MEQEDEFETHDETIEGLMFKKDSKILIVKEDDQTFKWKPSIVKVY
jgi:hypothetical protein